MNIYIFVITIVACFTFKTFAAEQSQTASGLSELKSKQLELIIKTIEEKPKKEAKEVSSL